MLKIGFANKFFTLWSVSEPYKCYVTEYEFYWRVYFTYYQNLSTDEQKAKDKAAKAGVKNLEIDFNLKGSSSFYSEGERGIDHKKTPAHIYPSRLHPYGSGDIRKLGGEGKPEGELKALWVLYFRKDICFSSENPVRPEWRRPVVHARRRLLDLGVLVRYDKKVLAASYLEKYKEQKAARAITEALKNGHHLEDGARVELELKEVSSRFFSGVGQYGEYEFHIVTFTDPEGRAFYYKGSSCPNVSKTDFTPVRATVKLDAYNGIEQTNLKRFHIKK